MKFLIRFPGFLDMIYLFYIISKALKVNPGELPERHANITDWPEEKSEQKQIALELAAESEFHKK